MKAVSLVVALVLLAPPSWSQGSAGRSANARIPASHTVSTANKGSQVLFGPSEVQYVTRASSLRCELVAIGRRAGPMKRHALEGRRWVGGAFHYERGTVTEIYELGVEGLEQSFLLQALPPGSGDLIVRLRVRSDDPLIAAGAGEVTFGRPGTNGIRIEEVLGIDAQGNQQTGSLHRDGNELELVLPEAFVEGATLPLLVDPLITEGARLAAFQADGTPFGSEERLAVAYLPEAELHFAAWLDDSSVVLGTTVWGRLLHADGRPLGPIQQLTNRGAIPGQALNLSYAESPQVAAVRGSRLFVAIMRGGFTDGEFPHVTTIDTNGNIRVPKPTGGFTGRVDVGGNAHPTDVHAVLAHVEFSGSPTVSTVVLQKLDTQTLTVVDSLSLTGTGEAERSVAISPTEGGVGRYLVTWTRTDTGGDILGAVVDVDLDVLAGPFAIAQSPRAEGRSDVDGDGSQWVVAYERTSSAGDDDVFCRSVSYDPQSGAVQLGEELTVDADPGQPESDPVVAWVGESYLIGYTEQVGQDTDVFVRSLDWLGQSNCEGKLELFAQGTEDHSVQIASRRSAGEPRSRALVTWLSQSVDRVPSRGDLRETSAGYRVYTPRDGVVAPLGPACGSRGEASVSCARAEGDAFSIRLRRAAPGAVARLLVGLHPSSDPASVATVRRGCLLLPDPMVVFTRQTDEGGNAHVLLRLPEELDLVGQRLLAQWLLPPDPALGSGRGRTTTYGLSNAVEITLE